MREETLVNYVSEEGERISVVSFHGFEDLGPKMRPRISALSGAKKVDFSFNENDPGARIYSYSAKIFVEGELAKQYDLERDIYSGIRPILREKLKELAESQADSEELISTIEGLVDDFIERQLSTEN